MLSWTRYDESLGAFNPTAENLLISSADGLTWNAPQKVSPPDPSTIFIDIFPHLFSDRSGNNPSIAWTSNRIGAGGDILCAPLDLANTNSGSIQLTQGGTSYSPRIIPTTTAGIYVMVWVSSENEMTKPDIFYRFVRL